MGDARDHPVKRIPGLTVKLDIDPISERVDVMLAIVFTACTAFWGDLTGSGLKDPHYLASVLTSIGMVLPTAVRRSRPWVMVICMTIASCLQLALVPSITWSLIAIPFSIYTVARAIPSPASRIVVVLGGGTAIAGCYRWITIRSSLNALEPIAPIFAPLILLCGAWVLIPYLLGKRDREIAIADAERTMSAIQKYQTELARKEERVRAAQTNARNEIARELHDIVAHSLSVLIVQAQGGRAMVRKRPDAAIEVLDTIAETGREALVEMRRIVGVLRADDSDSAQFRPSPGLDDVPELVHHAGERVHLMEIGTQPRFSPVLGLTVYRVVQESVTNALKYAGDAAQVNVVITYGDDEIDLKIIDDGAGQSTLIPRPDSEAGFGIKGMTERVTALGGTLTAQPARQGGWVVHAHLPIDSYASSAQTAESID